MKTCCWCGDRCRGRVERTFLSAKPGKRSKAERHFASLSVNKERDYAGRRRSQSGWQEGRAGGVGGRDFWREGQPAPAARSFAVALARTAQRHAQGQGKERSERRGPQTLEAEGHRPRACGLDPLASLASWRHAAWTQAARLQLFVAKENVAGRAALGVVRKTCGAKADGRGCMDSGDAQDQGVARGAGQAEAHQVSFAGSSRRERQSGTREPQHRRRNALRAEWFAALRRAEA